MGNSYKVMKIQEQSRLNEDGEIEKVYRFDIRTKKGTRFSIVVPERDSVPENVKPIIEKKAQELDSLLED